MLQRPQCAGPGPGETEEELGQEALQSPEPPGGANSPFGQAVQKEVVAITAWQKFDKDVDKVMEATAERDMKRRLQTMTTIIVSMAAERFGVEEERVAKQHYTKNQRATQQESWREQWAEEELG